MHSGSPHDGPIQPGAHTHAEPSPGPRSTHSPCGALQSSTQSGCAQSAPVHPASHAHTPLLHSPRAEHSGFPGHTRSSHAAPPHTTAPLSSSGPGDGDAHTSGAGPVNGGVSAPMSATHPAGPVDAWQRQIPGVTQVPRPEQSSGHTAFEQSAPVQPLKHSHCPGAAHLPWTQPPAHTASVHAAPLQPGSHAQRPASEPLARHAPWAAHPGRQTATSHATPRQPPKQSHTPGFAQTPWPEHAGLVGPAVGTGDGRGTRPGAAASSWRATSAGSR